MDNNTIKVRSTEDLQGILNAFAKEYTALLKLALIIKMTQVQHQPPFNQTSTQSIIKVGNATCENVVFFFYLGSLLSWKAAINSEVNHRLSCDSGLSQTQEKGL